MAEDDLLNAALDAFTTFIVGMVDETGQVILSRDGRVPDDETVVFLPEAPDTEMTLAEAEGMLGSVTWLLEPEPYNDGMGMPEVPDATMPDRMMPEMQMPKFGEVEDDDLDMAPEMPDEPFDPMMAAVGDPSEEAQAAEQQAAVEEAERRIGQLEGMVAEMMLGDVEDEVFDTSSPDVLVLTDKQPRFASVGHDFMHITSLLARIAAIGDPEPGTDLADRLTAVVERLDKLEQTITELIEKKVDDESMPDDEAEDEAEGNLPKVEAGTVVDETKPRTAAYYTNARGVRVWHDPSTGKFAPAGFVSMRLLKKLWAGDGKSNVELSDAVAKYRASNPGSNLDDVVSKVLGPRPVDATQALYWDAGRRQIGRNWTKVRRPRLVSQRMAAKRTVPLTMFPDTPESRARLEKPGAIDAEMADISRQNPGTNLFLVRGVFAPAYVGSDSVTIDDINESLRDGYWRDGNFTPFTNAQKERATISAQRKADDALWGGGDGAGEIAKVERKRAKAKDRYWELMNTPASEWPNRSVKLFGVSYRNNGDGTFDTSSYDRESDTFTDGTATVAEVDALRARKLAGRDKGTLRSNRMVAGDEEVFFDDNFDESGDLLDLAEQVVYGDRRPYTVVARPKARPDADAQFEYRDENGAVRGLILQNGDVWTLQLAEETDKPGVVAPTLDANGKMVYSTGYGSVDEAAEAIRRELRAQGMGEPSTLRANRMETPDFSMFDVPASKATDFPSRVPSTDNYGMFTPEGNKAVGDALRAIEADVAKYRDSGRNINKRVMRAFAVPRFKELKQQYPEVSDTEVRETTGDVLDKILGNYLEPWQIDEFESYELFGDAPVLPGIGVSAERWLKSNQMSVDAPATNSDPAASMPLVKVFENDKLTEFVVDGPAEQRVRIRGPVPGWTRPNRMGYNAFRERVTTDADGSTTARPEDRGGPETAIGWFPTVEQAAEYARTSMVTRAREDKNFGGGRPTLKSNQMSVKSSIPDEINGVAVPKKGQTVLQMNSVVPSELTVTSVSRDAEGKIRVYMKLRNGRVNNFGFDDAFLPTADGKPAAFMVKPSDDGGLEDAETARLVSLSKARAALGTKAQQANTSVYPVDVLPIFRPSRNGTDAPGADNLAAVRGHRGESGTEPERPIPHEGETVDIYRDLGLGKEYKRGFPDHDAFSVKFASSADGYKASDVTASTVGIELDNPRFAWAAAEKKKIEADPKNTRGVHAFLRGEVVRYMTPDEANAMMGDGGDWQAVTYLPGTEDFYLPETRERVIGGERAIAVKGKMYVKNPYVVRDAPVTPFSAKEKERQQPESLLTASRMSVGATTVPMSQEQAQAALKQIGTMNVMAISGGRRRILSDGSLDLPVAKGYHVNIALMPDDTYRVRRVYGIGNVKGEMSGVYADQLGEVAYQASNFSDGPFGDSTSMLQSNAMRTFTTTMTPEMRQRLTADTNLSDAVSTDVSDTVNAGLATELDNRGIEPGDVEAAQVVWQEMFSDGYFDQTGIRLDDTTSVAAMNAYGSADELFESSNPSTLRSSQMRAESMTPEQRQGMEDYYGGLVPPAAEQAASDANLFLPSALEKWGVDRNDPAAVRAAWDELFGNQYYDLTFVRLDADALAKARAEYGPSDLAGGGGPTTLRSNQMRAGRPTRDTFGIRVEQARDGTYYYDITGPQMSRDLGGTPGIADVPIGLRGNNYPTAEMARQAGEDRLDRYEADGFPSLQIERAQPSRSSDADLDALAENSINERASRDLSEGESWWTPEEAAAYSDRFLDALIRNSMVPDPTLVAEKERRQGSTLRSNRMTVATDDYVGEVGQKVSTEATITGLRKINGAYGESTLVEMEDPEGRRIKTFTSAGWAGDARVGDRVALTATVKRQEEYRGNPETLVSRPKVTTLEQGSGEAASNKRVIRGVELTPVLAQDGGPMFVGPGANAQEGALPVFQTQYGDMVVVATSNRTGNQYLARVLGTEGGRFYNKAEFYDADKARADRIDAAVKDFSDRVTIENQDRLRAELEASQATTVGVDRQSPEYRAEVERLGAVSTALDAERADRVAAERVRLETEVYPAPGSPTLRANQMSVGAESEDIGETLDVTPDYLLDWGLGDWETSNGSAVLSLSYATDADEYFLSRSSRDPGGGVRTVSRQFPPGADPEEVLAELAGRAGWSVGPQRRFAEEPDKDVARFEDANGDGFYTLSFDRSTKRWLIDRTSRDPGGESGVVGEKRMATSTTPAEALAELSQTYGLAIGPRIPLGPDTANTLGVYGDRVPGSYTQSELNDLSDSYLLRMFAQYGDPAMRAELVSRGLLSA